jgi:hypothetical protein
MGGLGRPGKFLREVYSHEQSIYGTKEELTYYSHDSSEDKDETGMRTAGVFVVDGKEDGVVKNHPHSTGYCGILLITDDNKGKSFSRRSPITINQLNIIARRNKVEKYILYDNDMNIISGIGFEIHTRTIYMFDLSYALRKFDEHGTVTVKGGNFLVRYSSVEPARREILSIISDIDKLRSRLVKLEERMDNGEFE